MNGNRKSPNFVFINVDQMSLNDTISALGCKNARTPNIDRLISNGVCFMNSYSTDPVCCPARTSWWTGRYSSEHGVVMNNDTPLHEDLPDLGAHLKNNGYNTLFTGKWHVPGRNVRSSFSVTHEGSQWGEITDPDVTRSARSILRNYNSEAPFFLNIGYLNPHDICLAWSQEKNIGVPDPVENGVVSEDVLPLLPLQHRFDNDDLVLVSATKRKAESPEWNEIQWRYYLWKYYRLVEMVDSEIGLIMHEIENSRHRDNTIIIFSSDHGESMARHGTIGKSTLWDEVVKVPLVISSLGENDYVRKNVIDNDHLVQGIDIVSTVCDYAGIPDLEGARGKSLKEIILYGKSERWRDYVYTENLVFNKMIRTRDYKYIMEYIPNSEYDNDIPGFETHRIGREQLYHLATDSGETKNLAYDEKFREIVEKHRKILAWHETTLHKRKFNIRKGNTNDANDYFKIIKHCFYNNRQATSQNY
jgi:arylsulfatase A-like enzyme